MALPTTSATQYERFRRYYQRLEPILRRSSNRASIAAVFSFLAVSLFAWYAVRPTAQTILFLRREIADKTVVSQHMEDKINALIEAQAAYETLEDKFSLVSQAIPDNPQATELAIQLRNLALASSASISAIQVPTVPLVVSEATPGAKLTPKKPLEEFSIQVILTGYYEAIKAFLDGLAAMRQIVIIESIRINPTAGKTIGEVLQLSLKLKAYYSSF